MDTDNHERYKLPNRRFISQDGATSRLARHFNDLGKLQTDNIDIECSVIVAFMFNAKIFKPKIRNFDFNNDNENLTKNEKNFKEIMKSINDSVHIGTKQYQINLKIDNKEIKLINYYNLQTK